MFENHMNHNNSYHIGSPPGIRKVLRYSLCNQQLKNLKWLPQNSWLTKLNDVKQSHNVHNAMELRIINDQIMHLERVLRIL